jgi:hypothetical protein
MKMRKRSKHSLSNHKLFTCNMGELIPCGLTEVLPGDTIQQKTSQLIRVSPLVAPIMHPVYTYILNYFVPHRLVMDDWEDFITGGEDGADTTTFPTITFASGVSVNSLGDYLGLPTGVTNLEVSALPFRGYSLIYNEFFRNPDLTSKLTIDTSDGADSTTNTDLQNVLWEKDYFTSCQPEAQLGSAVSLPLGSSADVHTAADDTTSTYLGVYSDPEGEHRRMSTDGSSLYINSVTTSAESNKLYADLTTATTASINDLREAIMLQKEAEARQIFGASYHELLRYYGIQGHDARLNRPELLSMSRQIMQFSEVVQTGVDSTDAGLGNLGGHGISAMRSNRFRRFIPEHGYIFTMMFTRPKTMYSEGLHRHWSRSTKEDFFNINLQEIGMQEVLNKEVYAAHSSPDDTFGYNFRYQEYRENPSTIAGEFRDGAVSDHYHMARFFSTDPALNTSFVEANPTNRIYASTSTDQLYVMAHHSIQARRLVKKSGLPGRITL